MSFNSFNLDSRILKAIEEAGYTTPTPIQANAIPEIMKGVDLRASAQTGTGKTAAFLLPALHRIASNPVKFENGPRILILAPTRELAMQIAKESEKQSKYLTKTKTVCIYGGEPYPVQRRVLARPYEVLVATPGRLLDFLEQGKINLGGVEVLVLDEADRMLDMGFIEPVEQIAAATPSTRQTLLFSATLKGQVLNLSKRLLNNPVEINVIPSDEKHECIEQHAYFVDDLSHKLKLLKELLRDESIKQALIFTSTKQYAEELGEILMDEGHAVSALHGDMNQRQRARTLSNLRIGKLQMIVATDVAARGIDVSTISHVFNFDLPRGIEDYTHRIGRTGRAGAQGIAISFVSPKEHYLLRQIEVYIKQKIAIQVLEGFEPSMKGEFKKKEPRRFGNERSSFPKRHNDRPYSDRPQRDFNRSDRPQRDFEFKKKSYEAGEEKQFGNSNFRNQGPKPDFRSPKPEFRGEKPDFRGPRPEFRGEKPEFRRDKPEFRGEKSEFRGEKPDFRREKPDFRGPKPAFRGPKPEFKGEKPPFKGPKPEFRGPKPEFKGEKSEFRGPKPEFRRSKPKSFVSR